MKDHEKRELVNALRDDASRYANTPRMRERFASRLAPLFEDMERLMRACDAAAKWMDGHGEVVFAGGGWGSVDRMNEAREIIRTALQPNAI